MPCKPTEVAPKEVCVCVGGEILVDEAEYTLPNQI